MTVHAWVVGASGLLGSAVSEAVRSQSGWTLSMAHRLPWDDRDAFEEVVRRDIRALLDEASVDPVDRWVILWSAGAAVTSTPQVDLDSELAQYASFLAIVGEEAGKAGATRSGAVFYASSAGGVYAGSADPPFDEDSEPQPISPYGWFKLHAEKVATDFSESTGVPVLIGRIANLYGPGQRLDKMQGLISHLAKAQMSPSPASIYVSLDTLRDYIFVRDGAALILRSIDRLMTEGDRRAVVKNIASGQSVTIADLLGYFRLISKGHPHVMLGTSATASMQAHDLRLRSVVWTDLDAVESTPLAVGISQTMDDILRLIQGGVSAAR